MLDLYSAILIKGILSHLKSGLHHEYVEHNDSLKSCPRENKCHKFNSKFRHFKSPY